MARTRRKAMNLARLRTMGSYIIAQRHGKARDVGYDGIPFCPSQVSVTSVILLQHGQKTVAQGRPNGSIMSPHYGNGPPPQ